ncbi:hypothetical protein [Streptomyces sp. DH37]|uniref:hypothetical protein n=1 Tax=Streptomyces sp. DH37 TaxID=3040122 RepID=UPI0024436969|nr:hypothetical protein [Streptomyces sp. DH37]MDG9704826.1 hypothetical protein [Streptomyces sp. DH37]
MFELGTGDTHVIPREHIVSVERYDGNYPREADEQILKITLSPTSSLWMIVVHAKVRDLGKWFKLRAKSR